VLWQKLNAITWRNYGKRVYTATCPTTTPLPTTLQAIQDTLQQLYGGATARISHIDAQLSIQGGVLMHVVGAFIMQVRIVSFVKEGIVG
jgi:hypothetical protein